MKSNPNIDKNMILGDVYAHQGRFSDAAKLYRKSDNEQKAMEMYTDLRMFDLAQVITSFIPML